MVMETVQIRISKGLLDGIDELVKTEIYANRSDVIRDAVRKLLLDRVDVIHHGGNHVGEIHKKLAREMKSLEKVNILAH